MKRALKTDDTASDYIFPIGNEVETHFGYRVYSSADAASTTYQRMTPKSMMNIQVTKTNSSFYLAASASISLALAASIVF